MFNNDLKEQLAASEKTREMFGKRAYELNHKLDEAHAIILKIAKCQNVAKDKHSDSLEKQMAVKYCHDNKIPLE